MRRRDKLKGLTSGFRIALVGLAILLLAGMTAITSSSAISAEDSPGIIGVMDSGQETMVNDRVRSDSSMELTVTEDRVSGLASFGHDYGGKAYASDLVLTSGMEMAPGENCDLASHPTIIEMTVSERQEDGSHYYVAKMEPAAIRPTGVELTDHLKFV